MKYIFIHTFSYLYELEHLCTSLLISGARDNIPDSALSASSSMPGFGTNESRISLLRGTIGWTASISDASPWLMANFEKVMVIDQVQTLGNPGGDSWGTSFMICKEWTYINTY